MPIIFRRLIVAAMIILLGIAALVTIYAIRLDLDSQPPADQNAGVEDIGLPIDIEPFRGQILVVATSTARSPDGRITAGMELTELSRAYYTFMANGYEVDIASPAGGKPPTVIDDDLIEADYAFLNDAAAQAKLANTIQLKDVEPEQYEAVYFVGGKGVMFDFALNPHVMRIVATIYDTGGVVGAVCHGPAALLGVHLSDGTPLLTGRQVTGFTNEEELYLIPDAREIFPFLLEDGLKAAKATFDDGGLYLENTIIDGRLVTGQNPWSTWSTAEGMIRALGHEPVARARTREEHTIELLKVYWEQGLEAAHIKQDVLPEVDKRLLLMHAFIAASRGQLRSAYHIQGFALGRDG